MNAWQRASYGIFFVLMLACNGERMTVSGAGEAMGGSVSSGAGASGVDAPIRLEPTADCVHPDVGTFCRDGFCVVPAGCFIMGAPRDELGAGRFSNVQVQVTLTRPFWIQQTEVTNEQWELMGWGQPLRNVQIGAATCRDPGCPVSNVSFFDALHYANARSEQAGLERCYELGGCRGTVGSDLQCETVRFTRESAYECEGYRLPMEAEWEYAVRAGTKTAFYSGEAVATQFGECVDEPALELVGWYCRNSGEQAHPVAEKQPNGWGLHDLHGNVFEWCNDVRDGLGYGNGPLIDPRGTRTLGRDLFPLEAGSGAQRRVVRGGAYSLDGSSCTSADRSDGSIGGGSSALGFRLVRTSMAVK